MFPEPRQGLVEGSDQALTRRRGVSRDGRGATPFVAQVQKMGPGPGEVAADGRDLGGMGIRRAVQPAPGNPVGDVDERDSYRRLPPPRAGRPCPRHGSPTGREPRPGQPSKRASRAMARRRVLKDPCSSKKNVDDRPVFTSAGPQAPVGALDRPRNPSRPVGARSASPPVSLVQDGSF